MRRKALLFFCLLAFFESWSQNPATIFSIPNKHIVLPCGTTCTPITAIVPHIKQTTDYLVTTIPYLPFDYATPGGTEMTGLYSDDQFSTRLHVGFPFCFYGITYSSWLMGSNSNITFDTSLNNSTTNTSPSGYSITDPIPLGTGTTMYAKASIFGPYHDINPDNFTNPAPTTRKIEWRVEGTAPTRRFIASYNDVGYFSCGNAIKATHQMVLYENTGVIEVYIKDKPVCSTWNGGKAILGVQDETRTKSVSATGKNATQWGTTGMNEAYRFTPWGASPRFKKAELLVNGTVVALGDTASGNPGELNLNFPNVCPTTDSTAYILRVTYGSCADATLDVSYQDTVFVKRTTPTVSLVTADATCAAGGSILVNTTGGTGFQYSINGAASQPGNSFTNLHSGNYTVIVQSGTCSATAQASIALVNDLTVSALPTDTSMCSGAAFVPRITSSSSAATYSWTPTSGVNGSNQMQPNITTSSQNTQYIVTASRGECQARDSINVTVFQGATADAGPDATIIAGDQVQLQGSAPTGTYLWSPSTGLSATNILNPFASPDQTTTYTLTVTTTQGCTATDNAVVTVVPYCVKPMEAFTPNGDGINDKWLVTNGNCTTAAKTEVFNRYGHKVFESNNYKNDWDGTYKGSPLPDGTYYFVISYQLINGKTVYQKGNVTILR